MKRIRIVQIVGFILVLAYISLLILDAIYHTLDDLNVFIFSLLLVLIGINLIHKGAIIRSSSTLWFANNLISIALTILILNYLNLDINNYIYIFTLIPIIPTLVNLLILRVKIYVKVLILNFSIILPTMLVYFVDIVWYWSIIICVGCVILGIFVCRNINLDKEKIDGEV